MRDEPVAEKGYSACFEHDSQNYDYYYKEFSDVLAFERSELHRFAGKISRRREELFAYKRVVARRYKERNLVDHGGSRYLYSAYVVAGFGQYERFREENAEIKVRGRFFAHHYAVDAGYIAELIVGEVTDVFRFERIYASGF